MYVKMYLALLLQKDPLPLLFLVSSRSVRASVLQLFGELELEFNSTWSMLMIFTVRIDLHTRDEHVDDVLPHI